MGLGLGGISKLSNGESRAITAENKTGEKGKGGMSTDGASAVCARDLGIGWKISPCISLAKRSVCTLAEIKGPGMIQHIWMTCAPE
jgi:hypothetical protein